MMRLMTLWWMPSIRLLQMPLDSGKHEAAYQDSVQHGAGAKSDISQVRFADIWDTYHCGLSKAVRKRLQNGHKAETSSCFSTEQADPNAVC